MIRQKLYHYLDGNWVTSKNLKISVFDLSVLRGFGVFEVIRTYKSKPFLLEEHLKRFYNSAKSFAFEIPKTKKELKKIIFEGIKRNSKKELVIRLILTGGIGEDFLTPGKPSLIVMFTPLKPYPKIYYQKGVKVISYYQGQRVFAEVKSLNYISAVLALKKAKKQKAVEAIYIDEKRRILEGTTSNFFAIVDNRLFTPKKGILFGITRQLVINLARKINIKVEEKDIYYSQIKNFSEAFLTSTLKEIIPVVEFDQYKIGEGRVGKITKTLMKEFFKFIQG